MIATLVLIAVSLCILYAVLQALRLLWYTLILFYRLLK